MVDECFDRRNQIVKQRQLNFDKDQKTKDRELIEYKKKQKSQNKHYYDMSKKTFYAESDFKEHVHEMIQEIEKLPALRQTVYNKLGSW